MSLKFSIPISLALIAFFIADERSIFVESIFRHSLKMGNRTSITERLSQIGRNKESDYENFRISQLIYLIIPISLSTILMTLNFISGGIFLLLLFATPPVVYFVTERKLTNRVNRRKAIIESEFPAVVEMLTLAVGSGESTASAMKRISLRAHGYLVSEIKAVVGEVEAGKSLTIALDDMSRRLSSDSLRRFVDSLIISISRGTPLVETLTHSANESRNQERIRLMTAAGKSEISMMIPVVFLILPVSILFALYPSLTNLNLFGN